MQCQCVSYIFVGHLIDFCDTVASDCFVNKSLFLAFVSDRIIKSYSVRVKESCGHKCSNSILNLTYAHVLTHGSARLSRSSALPFESRFALRTSRNHGLDRCMTCRTCVRDVLHGTGHDLCIMCAATSCAPSHTPSTTSSPAPSSSDSEGVGKIPCYLQLSVSCSGGEGDTGSKPWQPSATSSVPSAKSSVPSHRVVHRVVH